MVPTQITSPTHLIYTWKICRELHTIPNFSFAYIFHPVVLQKQTFKCDWFSTSILPEHISLAHSQDLQMNLHSRYMRPIVKNLIWILASLILILRAPSQSSHTKLTSLPIIISKLSYLHRKKQVVLSQVSDNAFVQDDNNWVFISYCAACHKSLICEMLASARLD